MNKAVVGISAILGILFLVAAYVYFTTPVNHLPSFFPGFDAAASKIHTKHGIGALILGLACFIFAWFQSGKKASSK